MTKGRPKRPKSSKRAMPRDEPQPKCRSEDAIFEDIKVLTTQPGYIHALALLSFKSNVLLSTGSFTSEEFAPVYDKSRLLRTEINLLLGLMLTKELNDSWPGAITVAGMAAKSLSLMEELHQAVLKPGHTEFLRSISAFQSGEDVEEPFGKGMFLREAIFYGPESAFPFQYFDLAQERYEPDSEWLIANKGFTIGDAVHVLRSVRDLVSERILEFANEMRLLAPSELVNHSFLSAFAFEQTDLTERSGRSAKLVNAVLDAFTYPAEDRNLQFTAMSAFNKASIFPILRMEENTLVSMQEYSLAEAAYENPFYWIGLDKPYLGKHSQTRGRFTEVFTRKRLECVFNEHFLSSNVVLLGDDGQPVAEADALLIYGRRAYVIQAKSKRLTLESKSGDDEAIAHDFKKAVQEAYDQAITFIDAFESGSAVLKRSDSGDVPERDGILEFYPICVTSEHYPALSFQSRQFLQTQDRPKLMPPLVFDVFSIDVLAEFLTTPLLFSDYLHKRASIGGRVIATHELVVFSYHLRKNLHLGDVTMLSLDDSCLIDVDLAMAVRRTGLAGVGTPPGILTRFSDTLLQPIFNAVNASTRPDVHRLGELLLGISGDAADELCRNILRICELTKADGGEHDVTMGFGDSGITVHCNRLSESQSRDRLLSHATMRKYTEKCDTWYGVTVTELGEPRLMIGLENKWQIDLRLERMAGDFRVRSVTHSLGPRVRRKIGRNEICPCGSARKYKHCHGK